MSHMRAFVVEQFCNVIVVDSQPKSAQPVKTMSGPAKRISEPVKTILGKLFEIQAVSWMLKFSGDFMRFAGLKVASEQLFNNHNFFQP